MATRAEDLRFTSRSYCHLCDEMIAGLRGLRAGFRFRLGIVDFDNDPELNRRFGTRVPVLVHEGRESCHYRPNTAVVTAFLSKIR